MEALGITWAVIGIRKASKSLNAAIRQFFCRNNNCVIPMIEFFVRITLALLLLFNPIEKISNHVIILGLEIIAVSIEYSGFHVLSKIVEKIVNLNDYNR